MSEATPSNRKRVAAWSGLAGSLLAVLTLAVIIYVPRMLSGGPDSELSSLRLIYPDGSPVNEKEVPMGERLEFSVTFKAKYDGSLRLSILHSGREEVAEKTFEVSSSGDPQTRKLEFTLKEGSGASFSAVAILEDPSGDEALKKESHLPFGAEISLDEDVAAGIVGTYKDKLGSPGSIVYREDGTFEGDLWGLTRKGNYTTEENSDYPGVSMVVIMSFEDSGEQEEWWIGISMGKVVAVTDPHEATQYDKVVE